MSQIKDIGRRGIAAAASRFGQQERLGELRLALGSRNERRNQRDDDQLTTLMASVLRRDSHCIDIGAHHGSMVAHMLRLAPAGRHLGFEPLPEISRRLAVRFPAVDVRQVALSNRSGTAQFTVPPVAELSSPEYAPAGQDPETWRGPILDAPSE